jgi:DNA-binding NtrC family response regulator
VCPEAAVILLTGHGSVETAVTAIKKGAEDFLEKDPSSLEVTEVRVEKALEMLKPGARTAISLPGPRPQPGTDPRNLAGHPDLNGMVDLWPRHPRPRC